VVDAEVGDGLGGVYFANSDQVAGSERWEMRLCGIGEANSYESLTSHFPLPASQFELALVIANEIPSARSSNL